MKANSLFAKLRLIMEENGGKRFWELKKEVTLSSLTNAL